LWLTGVIYAGLVEARRGEDDEVAMDLLAKLSTVSRKRWPADRLPDVAGQPALLPVVPS
jgi:coenzyme F420 hydrogenase subunit beta